MVMPFKGLTIKEKMQIAESVVPFDLSFNRRCPGIFASPCPCIGFNESNYRECKFNSTETICGFSTLYRELEDSNKNRKYLTYNEKREISIQSEKTKCLSRQPGRNCPLDNNDADPNTFCESYKQGDGYMCNVAKDDPIEDEYEVR